MNANLRKQALSVMAVSLVILSSFGCAAYVMDDEEEDDGNPVTIVLISYKVYKIYNVVKKVDKTASLGSILKAALIGGAVGAGLEYLYLQNEIEDLKGQIEQLKQYARYKEVDGTAYTLNTAKVFTDNALMNYSNIWKMTGEHWIRQAEMSAFSIWDSYKAQNLDYSSEAVLVLSMIYSDNAMAGANSVAQINTFLEQISQQKVKQWNTTEGYESLRAYYSYGGSRLESSNGDFGGSFVTVADARNSAGTVFIQTNLLDTEGYVAGSSSSGIEVKPGTMYLFGSDTVTLTDRLGKSFVISGKETDLSKVDGLETGVYTVSKGAVIASDAFAETVGVEDALDLTPGLVMSAGDDSKLAKYEDGSFAVVSDGSADSIADDISLGVYSSDIGDYSNPDPISLKSIFENYNIFLDRLTETANEADSSARALWKIYDAVGESNAWTTTLSVLNNYENVTMSDSMKSAMAVSSMQQIAQYYQDHDGDLTGMELSLNGTGTTNVSFVRGTIYDDYGNVIASDVIFTPLLQTSDTVLNKSQKYTVDSYATAMVWNCGQSILTWSETGDFEDYTAVPLKKGYSFTVDELAVKDSDDSAVRAVDTVSLDVKHIDYVKGIGFDWDPPDPVPGPTDSTDWLKIVCICAGLLAILYGVITRRIGFIMIGAMVLVFAFVFADTVWDRLVGS